MLSTQTAVPLTNDERKSYLCHYTDLSWSRLGSLLSKWGNMNSNVNNQGRKEKEKTEDQRGKQKVLGRE
jgi:hypothetical protein